MAVKRAVFGGEMKMETLCIWSDCPSPSDHLYFIV